MRTPPRRELPSDSPRWNRRAKLLLESLEPRQMLSANAGDVVCHPNLNYLAGSAFNVYSPAQIRHAYGFDQVSWNGAGQTIAIVDAYDDPTVATDLHTFDHQFGLADPKLTVAKMTSGGRGPAYDSGWATEIALDVEWAHAVAPGANILLVEAVTSSLSDLLAAVNYARNQVGVSVVSMSWGAGEFSGEGYYDSVFTTPAGHAGVTFVASSGDNGAPASWPSISTNVLSVGGTTLALGSGNSYGGEKAWSGSGGGYSPYESEPAYQRSVQTSGYRSNPDVAYDADPYSGFYVCQKGSWYAVGGTSAGAPQWAGLLAVANQGRAAAGRAPLSTALQAIYSLAAADFHDITTGSNGYKAGVGYDAATGRGSPIVSLVVRDLVAYGTTATAATSGAASTPAATPTGGRMVKASEIAGAALDAVGVAAATAAMPAETIVATTNDGTASRFSSGADTVSATRNYAFADSGASMNAGASDDMQVIYSARGTETAVSIRDAAFESSLSGDDLESLDRVQRLISRCLESSAGFGARDDRAAESAAIDACLVDQSWLSPGGRASSAKIQPEEAGITLPAALLTIGMAVGKKQQSVRELDC